jgi:hypothetical protein
MERKEWGGGGGRGPSESAAGQQRRATVSKRARHESPAQSNRQPHTTGNKARGKRKAREERGCHVAPLFLDLPSSFFLSFRSFLSTPLSCGMVGAAPWVFLAFVRLRIVSPCFLGSFPSRRSAHTELTQMGTPHTRRATHRQTREQRTHGQPLSGVGTWGAGVGCRCSPLLIRHAGFSARCIPSGPLPLLLSPPPSSFCSPSVLLPRWC